MEVTNSWTEVLPLRQLEPRTGLALAALETDFISPPSDGLISPLKTEENDYSCDGDSGGEGSRENIVILI